MPRVHPLCSLRARLRASIDTDRSLQKTRAIIELELLRVFESMGTYKRCNVATNIGWSLIVTLPAMELFRSQPVPPQWKTEGTPRLGELLPNTSYVDDVVANAAAAVFSLFLELAAAVVVVDRGVAAAVVLLPKTKALLLSRTKIWSIASDARMPSSSAAVRSPGRRWSRILRRLRFFDN